MVCRLEGLFVCGWGGVEEQISQKPVGGEREGECVRECARESGGQGFVWV